MTRPHHILLAISGLAMASAIAPLAPSMATAQQGDEIAEDVVRVPGGRFQPFYRGTTGAPVDVAPFALDVLPVTNEQFLAFVRATPRWRRSSAPGLFVDDHYLSHWAGDLELGEARPRQPVTNVSWFAARAYCASRGARLPTEAEWELVARADEHRADATEDPAFVRRILEWYSHPHRGALPDVGGSPPNVYGVRDLHGLAWEWVDDFDASMVSADDRQRGDAQMQRFCGGASLGAEDVRDYATFMRYAFRSSLEARYAVHNLGFRCARSLPE